MPVSRRRRNISSRSKRAELKRRKRDARFRIMLHSAESALFAKAREAGRVYCSHQVIAGYAHVVGTGDLPDTVEPVFADCGGRLRPFKVDGQIVDGVLRCRRCGRDEVLPTPAPVAFCTTCAGTGVLEYRNQEGNVYSSPCPDCDTDTCPRCDGSFKETGGKPVEGAPYFCQKCAAGDAAAVEGVGTDPELPTSEPSNV